MKDIMIFRRVEKKYRLTPAQKDALLERISSRLTPDAHGCNTICSLYLDTPDHLLIRNSIVARVYKEKLRLRSYGIPSADTDVFLEIKKKYKGVVYKRREVLPLRQAMAYIRGGPAPVDSQIMRELDYAMHFYRQPQPAMLIAYEREAYFDQQLPSLRITFDTNVRYRDADLLLDHGHDGTLLLPPDAILMEIKTDGAMPVWLARALSECSILPSSFSKYGNAYQVTAGLIPPLYTPEAEDCPAAVNQPRGDNDQ
ncbi:MAG: polyphosphate polymerase domain-containing protein [Clostridia bacterium]|nr:polyphosphate polymerase domain-containing protein [Clostridia bacterium]